MASKSLTGESIASLMNVGRQVTDSKCFKGENIRSEITKLWYQKETQDKYRWCLWIWSQRHKNEKQKWTNNKGNNKTEEEQNTSCIYLIVTIYLVIERAQKLNKKQRAQIKNRQIISYTFLNRIKGYVTNKYKK